MKIVPEINWLYRSLQLVSKYAVNIKLDSYAGKKNGNILLFLNEKLTKDGKTKNLAKNIEY